VIVATMSKTQQWTCFCVVDYVGCHEEEEGDCQRMLSVPSSNPTALERRGFVG